MRNGIRGALRGRVALHTAVCVVAVCAAPGVLSAQRGMQRYFGDPNEYYVPPAFHGNAKYDGRFTFARLKYRGYAHFTEEGPGWSHD